MNITVKYYEQYDCLENLVVAVARWWGHRYELGFAESWGFQYNRKNLLCDNNFGKNIYDGKVWKLEYLEKYHGIKVNNIEQGDYHEILDVIRAEVKKDRPVIIYMNTFWCPWYKEDYQKVNSPHYCMVTDIDNEDNIHIKDAQMAENGALLPIDDFSKGFGNCITLSLKECESINDDWKKIIYNAVDRVSTPTGEICMFEQMRNFAEDLKDKLDFSREIKGKEDDPFQAALFEMIRSISRGRMQFSEVLNYMGELVQKPELMAFSNRMKAAGQRWNSVFGMLCKAYYLQGAARERILDRIIGKIYEAASDEEDIALSLIEFCKNGNIANNWNTPMENNLSDKAVFMDCSYVDITKHMNNQGFSGSLSTDCKAEISNGGRYFLTEGLPIEREWKIENMKFLFPEADKEMNDNISCFGQVIELEPGKYTDIMVLGCAEFGNHSESIEILYCDGHSEEVPLQFTSWLSSNIYFNETIAWTGKGAVRSTDRVVIYPFPVNLFAKSYTLKSQSDIIGIRLPECPNIHVFAITLANRKGV